MPAVPNKHRQPLAYWVFWGVFIALVVAIMFFAYWNIQPYEAVMRTFFRVSTRPFSLFNRFKLSQAWLVGAIVWAICQGFQIGYLLLVESEKAMDFIIKRYNSAKRYEIDEQDPGALRTAKQQHNQASLSVLLFFGFARLFAYGIEIPVNLSQFPLWDNGSLGFLMALFTLNFKWANLAIFIITLLAVEYLVLGAIMVWRMLQLFKQSGAYQKSQGSPAGEAWRRSNHN